jgi:hypothetical protein
MGRVASTDNPNQSPPPLASPTVASPTVENRKRRRTSRRRGMQVSPPSPTLAELDHGLGQPKTQTLTSTVTDRASGSYNVGAPKEEPNAADPLISSPCSPTTTKAGRTLRPRASPLDKNEASTSKKVIVFTSKKTTTPTSKDTSKRTAKKAVVRKRNAQGQLTNEDVSTMKTLPNELRGFFEKEARYSNAEAGVDCMLGLPRPKLSYLDSKLRLTCNDMRFAAFENGGNGRGVEYMTAGLPSEKAYAPYFEATTSLVPLTKPGSCSTSALYETNDTSQEEAFHSRPSIKLIIPDVIKALLVDDWENVTKNMQLVPLPHPKPVTKILEDYSAYEMPKRSAGSSHADILEETLSGLREYFDKSLGRILLYK